MLDRLRDEPVLLTTVVGAVLVLLVQFGVPISDGQADAVTAVLVAVLAVFARSKVSPAS